jgi:O-antigen/teichoic acid export membrane protein
VRLRRNAVESFAFRVLGLPLGFVTTVITSRFLLPEGRGAYALGVLTVMLASTALSNATGLTHEIGKHREPVQTTVGRGLLLSLVLGSIGALVLLPVMQQFSAGSLDAAEVLVLGLPAVLLAQSLSGALLGVGRIRLFYSAQLADSVTVVVAMLVLVVGFDQGLGGAIAAWLIARAVSLLLLLVGARDLWLPLTRAVLTLGRTIEIFLLGFRAAMTNFVGLLNFRIEFFLLELYDGLDAVGIYSVSLALTEVLWVFSSALDSAVVAPAIRERTERAVAVVAEASRHCLILTFGAGIVLAIGGIIGIPILFGRAYEGAIVPLLLLIPGVVAYTPSTLLSTFFSIRLGRVRFPLVAAATSTVLTTLLCLVLIPRFGAEGAALASSIGYLAGISLLFALFVRVGGVGVSAVVPRPGDLGAYRDLLRSFRSQVRSRTVES